MKSKKWYQTKSQWLNILGGIGGVAANLIGVLPPKFNTVLIAAGAIINLILNKTSKTIIE